MELNNGIIEILNYLHKFGSVEVRDSLKVTEESASICSGNETLVKINDTSIDLFSRYNLQKNIVLKGMQIENTIHMDKVQAFLESISISIVRLNHVGISYSCKNYKNETKKYIEMLNTKFKLFQEESDSKNNRWYFIGDRNTWKSPLFEIVLTENEVSLLNEWTPHFQIDIDTTLKPEELERKLKSNFGKGFDWYLDIPNLGIVLEMKILGSINGTKICLGTGTAKRGTEYHRKNILKDVTFNLN